MVCAAGLIYCGNTKESELTSACEATLTEHHVVLASSWDSTISSHADKLGSRRLSARLVLSFSLADTDVKETTLRKAADHLKDVTHLASSEHLGLIATASSDQTSARSSFSPMAHNRWYYTTVCLYEWSIGPMNHRYDISPNACSCMVRSIGLQLLTYLAACH